MFGVQKTDQCEGGALPPSRLPPGRPSSLFRQPPRRRETAFHRAIDDARIHSSPRKAETYHAPDYYTTSLYC